MAGLQVAAIMPCRGRTEQTVTNVRRLLATAGDVDWRLWCVGSKEDGRLLEKIADMSVNTITCPDPRTYWQALSEVSDPNATLYACLANDLLPAPQWLARAVEAYHRRFGDTPAMVGFNGDGHGPEHSCHFLIHRDLLTRYGGWPVWYHHNFGDTELCQRAIQDGLYAKAPWAILYHDHPISGAQSDQVYQEGSSRFDEDRRLFQERQRRGWPNSASIASHKRA